MEVLFSCFNFKSQLDKRLKARKKKAGKSVDSWSDGVTIAAVFTLGSRLTYLFCLPEQIQLQLIGESMSMSQVAERDRQRREQEEALLLEKGIVRISLPIPFSGEPVNALLVLGDSPALIDTGYDYANSFDIIEKTLREHHLEVEDLAEIWLTHPHLDHFGLAGRLARQSGAKVYAWESAAHRFENYLEHWPEDRNFFVQWLRRSKAPDKVLQRVENTPSHFHDKASPLEITNPFSEGNELCLAGRLQVEALHLPGHTPWCTALWMKELNMLVSGDIILARTLANPLLYPYGSAPREWQGMKIYHHSLQRIRALPVERVMPGHGLSFENFQAVIDRAVRKSEWYKEKIQEVLREESKTAYDVARIIFGPELMERALTMIMSKVINHIEWLEAEGLVLRHSDSSFLTYSCS